MTDKTVEKTKEQVIETKPVEKNRSKLRPPLKRFDKKEEKDPFDHKIIDIRRVTKMYKGGRRMKISVFVVVGDKKGRVGLGIGKGSDVKTAQDKAISKAKKSLSFVQLKGNTIPHQVKFKFRAATVLMKPASAGTGVIAGSSMRMVAEVVGIKDILGKVIGSNNQITNAYATIGALKSLRSTRL